MKAVLMGQTGQKYVSNQNWRQAVKNKTKKTLKPLDVWQFPSSPL